MAGDDAAAEGGRAQGGEADLGGGASVEGHVGGGEGAARAGVETVRAEDVEGGGEGDRVVVNEPTAGAAHEEAVDRNGRRAIEHRAQQDAQRSDVGGGQQSGADGVRQQHLGWKPKVRGHDGDARLLIDAHPPAGHGPGDPGTDAEGGIPFERSCVAHDDVFQGHERARVDRPPEDHVEVDEAGHALGETDRPDADHGGLLDDHAARVEAAHDVYRHADAEEAVGKRGDPVDQRVPHVHEPEQRRDDADAGDVDELRASQREVREVLHADAVARVDVAPHGAKEELIEVGAGRVLGDGDAAARVLDGDALTGQGRVGHDDGAVAGAGRADEVAVAHGQVFDLGASVPPDHHGRLRRASDGRLSERQRGAVRRLHGRGARPSYRDVLDEHTHTLVLRDHADVRRARERRPP
ncbi:MAG: hypothetical protein IPN17_37225 [Deltaproteobacteria bacterium]|nr:hypothetical protein [Deltaproteobacteria bacterium]